MKMRRGFFVLIARHSASNKSHPFCGAQSSDCESTLKAAQLDFNRFKKMFRSDYNWYVQNDHQMFNYVLQFIDCRSIQKKVHQTIS